MFRLNVLGPEYVGRIAFHPIFGNLPEKRNFLTNTSPLLNEPRENPIKNVKKRLCVAGLAFYFAKRVLLMMPILQYYVLSVPACL